MVEKISLNIKKHIQFFILDMFMNNIKIVAIFKGSQITLLD